ncbi:hypothetical protein BH23ACT9_BH23ACT9_20380 [soil metagenome]
MTTTQPTRPDTRFVAAREHFGKTLAWLEGPQAAALTHAELEDQMLTERGSCTGC